MKIDLNKFTNSSLPNLFIHPKYKRFNYSDGLEKEDKIYNVLKHAHDKSIFSDELRNSISDWPTEYHFSQERHNLLRHIQIAKSHKILELGAGCGAITRQLGETGAQVFAVEGSMMRAECVALRCKDLSNVKTFCSDFQEIEFKKEFDLVTLIGVLEYTPVYFKDNDPFAACLELVKKALKPGGRLIIAIENRLGLKYFLGFSEDHYGIPYIGIQDLYQPRKAKTFSQSELKNRLISQGFQSVQFQYPFPDYKIPSAIFTQKAFEIEKFSPSQIIFQTRSRDYLKDFSPSTNEGLVWQNLDKNLIPQLANSFLVTAKIEPDKKEKNNSLLAVTYNTDRKKEYKTETRFICKDGSSIEVIKGKLLPKFHGKSNIINIQLGRDKYIFGQNLSIEMLKNYLRGDVNKFYIYCNKWLELLKKYSLAGVYIKPEFIDCIPANLILRNDKLDYFDREWNYNRPYTLEMLVIRGLYQFQTANSLEDFIINRQSDFSNVIHRWFEEQNIVLSSELINKFIEAENEVCDEVYGETVWQPIRVFKKKGLKDIIERLTNFYV